MADIEKVTQGAKDVTKRVKDSDALNRPVGLAVAGAALAALPFAVEKLTAPGRSSPRRPTTSSQARRRRSSPRSRTRRRTLCPTRRAS